MVGGGRGEFWVWDAVDGGGFQRRGLADGCGSVWIRDVRECFPGIINTLYVNGVYKGYFNMCEHIREDFLQRHHGSDLKWDVQAVTTIANGDGLAFQEMITFIKNNPQSTLANWQAIRRGSRW